MWKLNPFFCSAETLKEIADKLFDEREYEEANKYYKMLIRKYPESEIALLEVGKAQYSRGIKIFFEKGERDEIIKYANKSIKAFRKFLKLYPESDSAPEVQLYLIRNYYFLLKDYKQASAESKKLKRDYPESESAKLADLYIVTAKNQGGE